MISTRSVGLVIDTVLCLTLAKWETVSGQFGGYLTRQFGGYLSREGAPAPITSAGTSRYYRRLADERPTCGAGA